MAIQMMKKMIEVAMPHDATTTVTMEHVREQSTYPPCVGAWQHKQSLSTMHEVTSMPEYYVL